MSLALLVAAASTPRMRGSGVAKGLNPSGSGGLPMPPDARLLLPPLLGPSSCDRANGGLLPQIVLRGPAGVSPPEMGTGATVIRLMSAASVCTSKRTR